MSPDSIDKCIALAFIGLAMFIVYITVEHLLRRRKRKAIERCIGDELTVYDDIPSGAAVLMAWTEPGDSPRWHRAMQEEVRKTMPLLGRALDRMVKE